MGKKDKHQQLIDAAEEAIDNLFGDTSVSKQKTADDLRDLILFIETKIISMGEFEPL